MKKLKIVVAIVVAVAVALGLWATTAANASGPRYVLATAEIGSISQPYSATGQVARIDAESATFDTPGTVAKVNVRVGDEVEAGDVLATLDATALKLALLKAESALADAEANLYSAEHPPSTSAAMGGLPSFGGSVVPSQPPSALNPDVDDLKQLYAAIAEVTAAGSAWSTADDPDAAPTICDQVYNALQVDPEPTPTPTPSSGDPTGGSPAPSAPAPSGAPAPKTTPTPSPSPTPTPSPTPSQTPTAEPPPAPLESATPDDVEALSVSAQDISLPELEACGDARRKLALANAVLADYYHQLLTADTIAGSSSPDPGKGPSEGISSTAKSNLRSGSGSSTSASAIAQAEAGVLKAEQSLDQAKADLAAATLRAPISGTVGSLTLTPGGAATGQVKIIGTGAAQVTFELPLSARKLLAEGAELVVSPAGAEKIYTGKISEISQLETAGSAGDNPTYTTKGIVDDPAEELVEGSLVTVRIILKVADGVVTIPNSALTITGPGQGRVMIVDDETTQTGVETLVSIGAQGAGYVEITDGVKEGQKVAIADLTLPLPENAGR